MGTAEAPADVAHITGATLLRTSSRTPDTTPSDQILVGAYRIRSQPVPVTTRFQTCSTVTADGHLSHPGEEQASALWRLDVESFDESP
jgi:hypothetical protein